MAVPDSLGVTIHSVDDAVSQYKNGQMPDAKLLVLIKDVTTAYRLWKQRFPMESLPIGNLTPQKKTKILHRSSRLSEEHMPELLEMRRGGVMVYAQSVPTEKRLM